MPLVSTSSTAIKFGSTLRIGYRAAFSASAFTYITHYPSYSELPYLFTIPGSGQWEVEYTELCPSCSGSMYSDPITALVTIP
jgi:hypothetical protein